MMQQSWIQTAENLPQGHNARGDCPENCGSGGTLSIVNDHKRLWCSCFRCGFNASESKGQQTLAELARIRELNESAEKMMLSMELPHDFTTTIPRHGRAWLFKAGLSESTYKLHGIGYSKTLDRVILPVFGDKGELIWYQCRALHAGQKPKYLQPARDRSHVLYRGHLQPSTDGRAIIVEDILSAIRVGKHIQTYSLLGTKITTAQAARLSKHDRITTWLDPDSAGRKGAYRIRRTLGLLTEVDNIVTTTDPKDLTDKEILEWLRK